MNSPKTFVEQLIANEREIKSFYLVVKWLKEIDIHSNDLVNERTEVSKWEKVSQNFQQFHSNCSADRCREIFFEWSQFYAEKYQHLNGNMDRRSQNIFDSLKIIHILDLSQFWSSDDLVFQTLQQISHRIEIKNYLKGWKLKNCLNIDSDESEDQTQSDTYLTDMSNKLLNEIEDIEAFNLMVQMMESMMKSKRVLMRRRINWSKVNITQFGFAPNDYSGISCRHIFYYWSEFYAKNYDKLNGNLTQELQEIFDLLKIVHILDFTILWRPENLILSLLDRISYSFNELSYNCVHKENKPKKTLNNCSKSGITQLDDKSQQKCGQRMNTTKSKAEKRPPKNWNTLKRDLKRIGEERKDMSKNSTKTGYQICLNFDNMNLRKELLEGIYAYGMQRPSAVQQRAIVACIEGRDVIAQAQSGMGKTAAFVISILQMIDTSLEECQALILVPTRELAQQIERVVSDLGKFLNVNRFVSIGGTHIIENVRHLQVGNHVMVGTVGRVLDLINRKVFCLNHLKVVVLDEADKLLKDNPFFPQNVKYRGFSEEIFEIISLLKPSTQLFLSSATMPEDVLTLSAWFMPNPARVLVKNEELTLEGIKQFYVLTVNEDNKLEVFTDLYRTLSTTTTFEASFVYCNKRDTVDDLFEKLEERGIAVARIHGRMEQSEREDILRGFRVGFHKILLTSDLLGRGIDVQKVSLVVNYDLPKEKETYIHRVGRGGRFGRKGTAISFVTDLEGETLQELQRFYNTNIVELPTNWTQI